MIPDFKTFKKLAQGHSLVPTYEEIPADLDTPVTLYLKLARENPYSALLESVEGGERFARYSFISASHHTLFECAGNEVSITRGKHKTLTKNADPMGELKKIFAKLNPAVLTELPRFCGGAIGYVGYDMVRNFEKIPSCLKSEYGLPDALFILTDECVIFDHWKHKILIIKWNAIEKRDEAGLLKSYRHAEKALDSLKKRIRTQEPLKHLHSPKSTIAFQKKIRSNCRPKDYQAIVEKGKEYIRAGDIIQTVLSQRFEMDSAVDPFEVYRSLRIINPSPYLYFLNLNGFSIAGSSPEILVRKENESALTRPIAGTRPRGKDEKEDLKLEKELRLDPKERAEHLMLVDLGRNDLGRCCKAGTIQVSDFMSVERYSHVMHLVSTVEGKLKNGEDAFSLFRACFPAGTVSGAPKIRAMEIIEELESVRRDVYAGSVGYFSYSGNMDMAITIRTLLFKKGKVIMQAGAGIVADSNPEREEKETRSKAQALFSAVESAERNNQ